MHSRGGKFSSLRMLVMMRAFLPRVMRQGTRQQLLEVAVLLFVVPIKVVFHVDKPSKGRSCIPALGSHAGIELVGTDVHRSRCESEQLHQGALRNAHGLPDTCVVL